ncbi:MAG: hypothetical protein C0P72_011695 [Clostridia bacterium]
MLLRFLSFIKLDSTTKYGLRLAVLNVIVFLLCISFFFIMIFLFPGPRFPFIELLVIALTFAIFWRQFVIKLPYYTKKEIFRISIVGALPFLIIGMLGYLVVIYLYFGGFKPASVFVYSILFGVAILVGLICVICVNLISALTKARQQ